MAISRGTLPVRGSASAVATTIGAALLTFVAGLNGATAAELPVTCVQLACAGGPSVWVSDPSRAAMTVNQNRMNITQLNDREVFNWAEFNIGANSAVNFSQPGPNSVALNQIFQGSPSQILGQLTADGQVYLLNPNGIVFGAGSQVNVRGLIASSLAIDPTAITDGILAPQLLQQRQPAFRSDGRVFVTDAEGNVVTDINGTPVPVQVVVQDGAEITTNGPGGRITLLGQQVENGGALTADRGQIILGAGEKVYLQASDDPELRGLLIEVDAGGTAWNRLTGELSSAQGNITLAGLVVNHDGRAAATTSVSANGSVRLLARDTVDIQVQQAGVVNVDTLRAGRLRLGGASRIDVLPDATDSGTAIDEQAQSLSRVELLAREVLLESGAEIVAPGGAVALTALENPRLPNPGGALQDPLPPDPESRITLADGALIDVAGAQSEASVSRNIVTVELRANELRDAPLQRTGALRGQAVAVDIRRGTPLADVSGAVATIERGVAERLGAGGTVALDSQGSVDLQRGSRIDVSGGELTYTPGQVGTSSLVTQAGAVVNISDASPEQLYTRVVSSRTAQAGGYVDPGYTEGFAAGTVAIAGRELAINGHLQGTAAPGRLQRELGAAPAGGRLIVGDPTGQSLAAPDYKAPAVALRAAAVGVPAEPSAVELQLGLDELVAQGFTRTEIYSNGAVSLGADTRIELPAGGELRVNAGEVRVDGSLRAGGGTVELTAELINEQVRQTPPNARPGVRLGTAAVLDVSGNWNNDVAQVLPDSPIALDGGRILLNVNAVNGELILGDRAQLRADAGAWRQTDASVRGGNGGAIELVAGRAGAALETGVELDLSALGFGRGGTLGLTANQLQIVPNANLFGTAVRSDALAADPGPYQVADRLFRRSSFGAISLTATGPVLAADATQPLTISAGAQLRPQTELLTLRADRASAPTSASVLDLTDRFVPLPLQRNPSTLVFTVAPDAGSVSPAIAGGILLAEGATIEMNPRGAVRFSAPTFLDINGRIVAPAGEISAALERVTEFGQLTPGFDPTRRLRVGAAAVLDASGRALIAPQPPGIDLREGVVLDGGRISLRATRGGVELAAGSVLDVSGTATELTVPGPLPGTFRNQTVASAGGAISLRAAENVRLDGTLRAAGAANANGTRTAGGELDVAISRVSDISGFQIDEPADNLPTLPQTERRILIADSAGLPPVDGTVVIAPELANASGFDNLALLADDRIEWSPGAALTVPNRLQLRAPNLSVAPDGGPASARARSIVAGPALQTVPQPQAATGGATQLTLSAGTIDLVGALATQGVGTLALEAEDAIRLTGLDYADALRGELRVAGNAELTAAQLYPTSFTRFELQSAAADGVIRFNGTGATPAVPFSAQGIVSVAAAEIVQNGRIAAPLGQIVLAADNRLELTPDSVTSTASGGAERLFGQVQGDTNWVYEVRNAVFEPVVRPTDKRVELRADSILVAAGAVVDVAGGGDLVAYEFIPGPGGSVDALSPALSNGLFYALLPGSAPAFDTQEYAGTDLLPGDSLRVLSAVPGLLEAGEYQLLPARYALLPGAVLVEALPGVNPQGTAVATLADGTRVVAATRTVAGTAIESSLPLSFAVRPGSYAQELGEYRLSRGNDFFAARAAAVDQAAPFLPRDAGQLAVQVGAALQLDGQLEVAAAEGGRGARVDVSAERLLLVDSNMSATGAGAVEIDVAQLQALGAESLLLGGARARTVDATQFTTARREQLAANLVTLSNGVQLALEGDTFFALDPQSLAATQNVTVVRAAASEVRFAPGVALPGNETVLTATDLIELGAGAALTSTAAATSTNEQIALLDPVGNAGGALLRVAGGSQVDVLRATTAADVGDIVANAGAVLGAAGSVTVDAAGTARTFGDFELGGGELSLASSRIALGAEQVDFVDGLALNNQQLADLAGLSELRLIARNGIELRAGTALGSSANARLGRLILDGPALTGDGTDALLAADQLTVTNSRNVAAPPSTGDGGELRLLSDELVFGDGSVAVQNFAAVRGEFAGRIGTTGEFALTTPGDLSITTTGVVGAPGSALALTATGELSVTAAAGAAEPLSAVAGLGAAVALAGQDVILDTALVLPSGRVRVDAADTLTLGANAVLDTSGVGIALPGTTVTTPGGDVILAAGGRIATAATSRIDVSAATNSSAAAGSLAVRGAAVELSGELAGSAAQPETGGRLDLVAVTLSEFGELLQTLAAGGFSGRQVIETTTGNLAVGAASRVTAADIQLTASGGRLTVDGILDAGGTRGGQVVLAARDAVELGSTAQVLARATTPAGDGGNVAIASTAGTLELSAASQIDVAGGAAARDGRVHLRALADTVSNDIAIASLPTSVVGARELVIEPFQVFADVTTVDAGVQAAVESALANYAAPAQANIAARLGLTSADNLAVRPGAELRSSGAMAVNERWDLVDQRYNGQAGVLTLRAAGDIDFNAGIVDAFTVSGFGPTARFEQAAGPSWSFTASAGADLNSAAPGATLGRGLVAGETGSLRLADTADLRTGTGDIALAADRDIEFSGPRATVYTVGVAARPAETSGFGPLSINKNWARDGGDISLRAGRDIRGAQVEQYLTGWAARTGGSGQPTHWAIDFDRLELVGFSQAPNDNFNQGIATLGGGDIAVRAGRDLRSVFATVGGTGEQAAPGSSELLFYGGGQLVAAAGRDLLGGGYANFQGDSRLSAGRAVSGAPSNRDDGFLLRPLVSQGPGSMSFTARTDLQLESAINPTATSAGAGNILGVTFFLSEPDDSMNLLALGGDVVLSNDRETFARIVGGSLASVSVTGSLGFGLFPASFSAAAPSGDISILRQFGLLPSPAGNLELVAQGSLRNSSDVTMSDAELLSIPSPLNPASNPVVGLPTVTESAVAAIHGPDSPPALLVAATGDVDGGIYSLAKQAFVFAGNDVRDVILTTQNSGPEAVTRVEAGRDITFSRINSTIEVGGPGALEIFAGRDINLGLASGIRTIGNTRNANIASSEGAAISLYAGLKQAPDFAGFAAAYLFASELYAEQLIEFVAARTGAPELTLEAARAAFAELPLSAQLPLLQTVFFAELEQGARDAVALLASGDQFGDFAELLAEAGVDYADLGLTQAELEQRERLGVAQLYWRGIDAFATYFGLPELTGAAAQAFVSDMAALLPGASEADVLTLLQDTNRVFIEAGSVATVAFPFRAAFVDAVAEQYPTADLEAVTALVPPADALFDGDLNMAFSQVYTVAGGDIDIFTPGGLVNVGLANPPQNTTQTKAPAQLGIVAQGPGAVRMFTDGDVLVNQSRVFTLAGGDIVIWSSNGDIDAGRGAKSSISAPEPTITVTQDGQIQVEFADAIAGSGIRGILTGEDLEPGDVVLVAPTGDINAGDAGIGSAGDAVIAALRCIGCDNINIAGSIASPVIDTGAGLTGGLGAAAAVTAGAAQAAEAAAQIDSDGEGESEAQSAMGWLEVFVEGFGDEADDDDNESI